MALNAPPAKVRRDSPIQMPTGNVTDHIGDMVSTVSPRQKLDAQKSMPRDGKSAACTALPRPADVSQKVPEDFPRRRASPGRDIAPPLHAGIACRIEQRQRTGASIGGNVVARSRVAVDAPLGNRSTACEPNR